MAYLADTNVLVYRYDPRFPNKQARATSLLREGLSSDGGAPGGLRPDRTCLTIRKDFRRG